MDPTAIEKANFSMPIAESAPAQAPINNPKQGWRQDFIFPPKNTTEYYFIIKQGALGTNKLRITVFILEKKR